MYSCGNQVGVNSEYAVIMNLRLITQLMVIAKSRNENTIMKLRMLSHSGNIGLLPAVQKQITLEQEAWKCIA